MKTILVPVEQHSLIHNVFEASVTLAKLFDSYIEGAAIGVDLPDVPIMDVAVGLPSVWDHEIRKEMAEASRQTFENYFTAKKIPRAEDKPDGLCWQWHPAGPTTDTMLGAEGRCFDITVVGRPSTKEPIPRITTVESALFESGHPVLVIPPEPVHSLNEHIMIAWNGSSETARAVAFAKPLLEKAKHVTVLGIHGWNVGGPSAEEMVRMLNISGIKAEHMFLDTVTEEYGNMILKTAMDKKCDLLIKGAYTQSRLRQMIFGGATNTILYEAQLPVLFAH
ncbi:universal stress protein [Microvirga sp. W0021]|uniref:Universal stress protein n=1 Tax=Hohaiivirga grylli TaxID=3133970 RepID=A0ABV0BLB2_9HYPH